MKRQLTGCQTIMPFVWFWLFLLLVGCDAWVLPRRQFVPATGLVAYFPFNGNVMDLGGNNLHGVLKNGATYGADRQAMANSALLLDGVDDYFEIPDNSLLRSSAFSVSLWIKPNRINSTTQLYSKSVFPTNANNQYTARITPPYTTSGTSGFEIIADIEQDGNCSVEEKNKKNVLYYEPGFQLNRWVHVVTVFEGSTGKLYLDGNWKKSATEFRNSPPDNCSGSPLRFGAAWEGDLNEFSGSMDEIRIYNRALSDAEVKALYQL